MKINLYDAQNFFRVKLEADTSGMTIRNIYAEIVASTDIDIMIWDGKGGNDRRKAIYPDYKTGRKTASENIWENLKFLREVLDFTRCTTVCVPGYEADDIIAHMACRLAPKGLPIHIWSTDSDLMQLCVIPTVTHMKGTFKGDIPFDEVRLYKTTVGDTSDRIKGIPGFGEKSYASADKAALKRFVTRQSDDIAAIGIKPDSAMARWMIENRDVLDAMWTITGPFAVDPALVDKHTEVGTPNAVKAEELFREFLM